MKEKSRNLILGIGLGLVLGSAFIPTNIPINCEKGESRRDGRLPEVKGNQTLILHPDYLNGKVSLHYTLLTDIDYNGDWDTAEKYYAGFTTGDGSRKVYFKKGFGPAQSMRSGIDVEFVKPKFFEKYQ